MDVPRKRQRPTGTGLSSPMQVGDESAQRGFQEVQAAIDELNGRISSTPEFDPSDLHATDAALSRELDALKSSTANLIAAVQQAISDLSLNFPVIRYAKVTAVQTGYVECTFWNPVASTAIGTVNVATQADHEVDDVILATQMFTGVTDGVGVPVGWQEVGGGGAGNVRMWTAATYAALSALTSPVNGDFGFVDDRNWYYQKRNGVWRILGIFEASTLQPPTPAGDGVEAGDRWYRTNTDEIVFYSNDDAQWHSITDFVEP